MNNNGQNSMPGRDPNFWQMIQHYFPHLMVGAATFLMAFLRAIQEGGKLRQSIIGAVICTLLSGSLYPVFLWVADTQDWPSYLAFAPCVFIAFLGTDWVREKVDDIYEVFVGRWLP